MKIYIKIMKSTNLKKNKRPKILNKYDVVEADIIDNCFFVNKKEIKNNYFDENYFLYFETLIL